MQNYWYILGNGAIGTLWAAKFIKASIPCVLLDRRLSAEEHCIKKQTLFLTEANGQKTQLPVEQHAIAKPLSIDKLLICTKSYQSEAALKSIAPFLTSNANVVLLQNGMGQHEQAEILLPTKTVIAASTTDGAMLESKLKVSHTGIGTSLFGSYNSRDQINKDIRGELSQIGMLHQPDIQQVLWNKLTINCVINPLTAIFNCKNGELVSNHKYSDALISLSQEVDLITDALGFGMQATNTLDNVKKVAKATANNYSSMHQDIKHQRKTEIDFINGYLQRQADIHGIALSINPGIITRIKSLEANFDIGK